MNLYEKLKPISSFNEACNDIYNGLPDEEEDAAEEVTYSFYYV